jgi:hypothetical protein
MIVSNPEEGVTCFDEVCPCRWQLLHFCPRASAWARQMTAPPILCFEHQKNYMQPALTTQPSFATTSASVHRTSNMQLDNEHVGSMPQQ